MIFEDPIFETDSTLGSSETFESQSKEIGGTGFDEHNANYIRGTIYSDVSGTLKIQFGDGTNWDCEESRDYTSQEKLGFTIEVVSPYVRVVYDNGSSEQSTFRLKTYLKGE